MEKFIIPGFPEEVSEVIETPDIAELLCYPMFYSANIETVYKHGSEWQKKLMDRLPLEHKTRYVNVTAFPSIMKPDMRALNTLGGNGNPHKEWHIDGNEERSHEHLFPSDRTHLFLAHTEMSTEFNEFPIEFTDRSVFMLNKKDFCRHFIENVDKYNPIAKKIELNRIYSFTNHLHRAIVPHKIEFRYSVRVRETDELCGEPILERELGTQNAYFFKGGMGSDIRVNQYGEIVLTPPLHTEYPSSVMDIVMKRENDIMEGRN